MQNPRLLYCGVGLGGLRAECGGGKEGSMLLRHRWLAVSLAFLVAPLSVYGAKVGQRKPPMTGTAVPEFAPFEQTVIDYGYLTKCTAAVAAISKDGELVYSRGFGWRDSQKKQPT